MKQWLHDSLKEAIRRSICKKAKDITYIKKDLIVPLVGLNLFLRRKNVCFDLQQKLTIKSSSGESTRKKLTN